MKLKIFFKGFNYMQDGPGNRLVYHLSGCNMHCPWCSNPEGMSMDYVKAKELSIDMIYDEIVSSRPMFFDEGGVTFTGGEVGLQSQPLSLLINMLNKQGINTAIESNASLDGFKDLLCARYLMVDFKHYDSSKLKSYVGTGNEKIKENFRYAIKNNKFLHVRIPLINGFNTEKKDILGFLEFFNTLDKEMFDVEFLPYHEYGKDKWKYINKEYKIVDGRINEKILNDFINAFKQENIKIIKT